MATTAWENKYKGGLCYASCVDLFTWYNNSILHCKKGCDFAVGRMNEENTRDEAQIMCKSYANELYAGNIGDLGKKFCGI